MNATIMLELSDGSVAVVDSQDLPIVASYAWSLPGDSAIRFPVGSRVDCTDAAVVFLHRLIADAGPDDVVLHRNHNTLDNRRENLVVMGRLVVPGCIDLAPTADMHVV